METIYWILGTFITATLTAFFLVIKYTNSRFTKINATLGFERKNVMFLGMYISFIMENDFVEKVRKLNRLLGVFKEHETILPPAINDVGLAKHLQELLADHLLQRLHGKDVIKAVKFIHGELHSVWHIYLDGRQIPAIMSRKTDFGFLETLYDVYGAESEDQAIERLRTAQSKFEEFKEKYLKDIHNISNNFNYVFAELEKRGEQKARQIASEWIIRGGNPTAKMYRAPEVAVDTGYDLGEDDGA